MKKIFLSLLFILFFVNYGYAELVSPQISSSIPSKDIWSNNNDLQFFWESSGAEAIGYRYILDKNTSTIPDLSSNFTTELTVSFANVDDGRWYFHIVAQNEENELSSPPTHWGPLLIDTVVNSPSSISSPSHPNPTIYVSNNDPSFEWSEPDETGFSGVSRYYYEFDNNLATIPTQDSEWTNENYISFNNVGDGKWYFHLIVEDDAGNISSPASHRECRIDTTALAPEVNSSSHPNPDIYYQNSNPQFQWNAPADIVGIAGYYCLIDNSSATNPSPISGNWTTSTNKNYSNLADGNWYFHIISKDNLGNLSSPFHRRIRIDTQVNAPQNLSSPTHPQTDKWYKINDISFQWNAPDDLAGIQGYYYKIDHNNSTIPTAADNWTTSSEVFLTDIVEGINYFHLVCKDNAGNIGNTQSKVSHYCIKIDTSINSPSSLISTTHPEPEIWYDNNNPQFRWNAPADLLSGIYGYYYILDTNPGTIPDEGDLFTSQTQVSLSNVEEGTLYFHLVAIDFAGNISSALHCQIKVDTSVDPPQVNSSTHPLPENWYTNNDPHFDWIPPDEFAGIQGYYYIFDQIPSTIPNEISGTWTTLNFLNFTDKESGIWYFHIVSKDNAGNVGTVAAHRKIKIDNVAPQPVNTLVVSPQSKGDINLEWDAVQDIHSGLKQYNIYRSTVEGIIGNLIISISVVQQRIYIDSGEGLSEGITYYYTIYPEDNLGNLQISGNNQAGAMCNKGVKKPNLNSSTHPTQDNYYSNNNPVFEIIRNSPYTQGYYYVLDQQLSTVPNSGSSYKISAGETTTISFSNLSDGQWYFHIVSRDTNGYIGTDALHYRVNIDITPPPPSPQITSPSHHLQDQWTNNSAPSFSWEIPQDRSGIRGYYLCLDTNPYTVPKDTDTIGNYYTTNRAYFYTDISEGIKYFHLTSVDNAGNIGLSASHYQINIDTTPPSPVIELDVFSLSEGNIGLDWEEVEDNYSGTNFYKVYRSQNSGIKGNLIAQVEISSYTDVSGESLTEGNTYYYLIEPVDNVNNQQSIGNIQKGAICNKGVNPPLINSSTHPEREWINKNNVEFSFNSVSPYTTRFYYKYDSNSTAEAITADYFSTSISSNIVSFSNVGDGIWYLHVFSQDSNGFLGKESSNYEFRVDVSSPSAPQISSSSHPDQNKWYNIDTSTVSWAPPFDTSGIKGYFLIIDQISSTVPNAETGSYVEEIGPAGEGEIIGPLTPDGTYYFHIVCQDKAGNVGTVAGHYRFLIDTIVLPPPVLSSLTHPTTWWYPNSNPEFSWSEPSEDGFSGVKGYYYALNKQPSYVPVPDEDGVYSTTRRSIYYEDISDGSWYFHVVTQDYADNFSEAKHCQINIDTQGVPPVVNSLTHPDDEIWYSCSTFTVSWNPHPDEINRAGVKQYCYYLDKFSDTLPNSSTHYWVDASTTALTFNNLEDGIWYFHITTKDNNNTVGPRASHFKIRIDTVANPPLIISSTHPQADKSYCWARPEFELAAPGEMAGVKRYYYVLNQSSDTIPLVSTADFIPGAKNSLKFDLLEDGTYWLHVIIEDNAVEANVSEEASHFKFQIKTKVNPEIDNLFLTADGTTVFIPKNAINFPTRLIINSLTEYPKFVYNPNCVPTYLVKEIKFADGTKRFNYPILVTFHWEDENIKGMEEKNLKIYTYDEIDKQWILLENSEVYPSLNNAVVSLDHFSLFTIMETKPADLQISGVSNYPNPFIGGQQETKIIYTLKNDTDVEIRIYDLLGELVYSQKYSANHKGGRAGTNEVIWDGKNKEGRLVEIGAYICVIESGNLKVTRKIGVK